MDPVIFIKLAMPEVRPLADFEGDTSLLTATHRFKSLTVLGFCAPDMVKGPGVSGVFNDVPRLEHGWVLELGIELLDLLPAFDGLSEAIVPVRFGARDLRLCLSNRMSRLHFADDIESHQVLFPRDAPWHGTARVLFDGKEFPAAEEQLRTMAAMQFRVDGPTAEFAFESSVKACIDTFIESINVTLRAFRACRTSCPLITRALRRDSVGVLYVLMIGDGKHGGARLAQDAGRVMLMHEELDKEQTKRFYGVVSGAQELSDVDQILGEARSSFEGGEYEFAFLQAVIAAEMATARTVRRACLARGVSKSKLDDNRREMSYSWALNIGLPLCLTPEQLPEADLIASMNAARTKRNRLMHEGVFELTREDLRSLLQRTVEYVNSLEMAAGPVGAVTSGVCSGRISR